MFTVFYMDTVNKEEKRKEEEKRKSEESVNSLCYTNSLLKQVENMRHGNKEIISISKSWPSSL